MSVPRALSVVAVVFWLVLSFGSCDSASRRAAMLAVLDEADSLNRSYIPIISGNYIFYGDISL